MFYTSAYILFSSNMVPEFGWVIRPGRAGRWEMPHAYRRVYFA
jgi:hypothetical protein